MGSLGLLKCSLLHTLGDVGHEGAKSLDEPPIKRCEAMKAPNFGDRGRSRP